MACESVVLVDAPAEATPGSSMHTAHASQNSRTHVRVNGGIVTGVV